MEARRKTGPKRAPASSRRKPRQGPPGQPLLVYWVHIELVYGRWLWFLKNNLTLAQTAVAAVAVILVMLGISALRTNWAAVRAALAETGWWYAPTPERVPGD